MLVSGFPSDGKNASGTAVRIEKITIIGGTISESALETTLHARTKNLTIRGRSFLGVLYASMSRSDGKEFRMPLGIPTIVPQIFPAPVGALCTTDSVNPSSKSKKS